MAIKDYTLGFVLSKQPYNASADFILLLRKKKPVSQKGKHNGIGGSLEKGETKEECIVREAKEEANLDTTPEQWKFIGTLYKPKKWRIYVAYAYISNSDLAKIPQQCEEGEFLLAWTDKLPENTLTNVRWLVPLIQGHEREGQKDFLITYHQDEGEEK